MERPALVDRVSDLDHGDSRSVCLQNVTLILRSGRLYVSPPVRNMTKQHDLMTTKEVLDYLGISLSTLERWVRKGVLRAIRGQARGYRRFRREEIVRLREELS